jgi:hypothetical protein
MAMLLKRIGDHRLIDDHRNAGLPYQIVGLENRTLALLADRVLAEVVLSYLEEDELPLTDAIDIGELKLLERRIAELWEPHEPNAVVT